MALRCNNCGAPLVVPHEGEQAYVVCSYCQTATALPQRRRPKPRQERRPANQVVVRSGGSSLPVKLFLAVAIGSLVVTAASVALKAFQEGRALPAALEAPESPGVTVRVFEQNSVSFETTRRETADADRAGPAAQPSATLRKLPRPEARAASPSAKASATSPPATASAAPPPPPAPSLPKNVKAVIGNIKIESGKYPMDVLKSRMASNTGAARACYEKTLLEKPDTEGTLNMNFQIAPAGNTRGVGVTGSFLPSNLSSCMNRAFLALAFPPTEGESVNVRFTVKLSHD